MLWPHAASRMELGWHFDMDYNFLKEFISIVTVKRDVINVLFRFIILMEI